MRINIQEERVFIVPNELEDGTRVNENLAWKAVAAHLTKTEDTIFYLVETLEVKLADDVTAWRITTAKRHLSEV